MLAKSMEYRVAQLERLLEEAVRRIKKLETALITESAEAFKKGSGRYL